MKEPSPPFSESERRHLLQDLIPYLTRIRPAEATDILLAAEWWISAPSDPETLPARHLVHVSLFEDYARWQQRKPRLVAESSFRYDSGEVSSGPLTRFLRDRGTYRYRDDSPERANVLFRVHDVVGMSGLWDPIKSLILRATEQPVNTLLQGETGTGKDQLARMLHDSGPTRKRPYLEIPCDIFSEDRYPSDFITHLKANGYDISSGQLEDALFTFGTLHLSHVHRLPQRAQAWLHAMLRNMETRQEDAKPLPRIISSTPVDIETQVNRGEFSHDLFLQLAIYQIRLPALRHYRGKIDRLAEHMLKRIARRATHPVPKLTNDAVHKLERHPWPGNLTELHNVMSRAMMLSKSSIRPRDIIYDRIFWGLLEEQDSNLLQAANTLEKAGFRPVRSPVEEIALFLLRAGDARFKASELADSLKGTATSTVRDYLKQLRRLGFIVKYGDRKATRYQVNLQQLLGREKHSR